jgi:Uma2 family endonuclease
MSAAPKAKLTPAEYLAVERKAAFKSEYLNGEAFAMAGASLPHTRIKDNIARALNNQFQGGPCIAVTSDLRVKVSATGLYTYPDVVVYCGPPEMEDDRRDTLLNPKVIIEVLSDSTERYDRGLKFRHYERIESFQEYILVAQDESAVERRVRQSGWDWRLTTIAGLDAELEFVTVPARIPLSEIYAGVTLPEPQKTGLLGPPPLT